MLVDLRIYKTKVDIYDFKKVTKCKILFMKAKHYTFPNNKPKIYKVALKLIKIEARKF